MGKNTDLARSVAPARPAAESLELILEGLPIGIERIDVSGEILYSNRAHHEMLGYGPGELVGRRIFDLVASREDAKNLERLLASLARDQPPPRPWTGLNRRKDGSTIEMRVDWQYERDAGGEVVGFVAALADITALRQAERARDRSIQALEDNQRHLESLKNSAVDFVLYRIETLPDEPFGGRVVFVSPSIREIMGTEDPEDFSTWFRDIHPEDRSRVLEANRLSTERGEAFDEVMRIRHRHHGTVRWIRAISRPVLDDQGVPRFFNGLILDITRERKAQEEKRKFELALQRSQRLESLGTLAGGIAHDFNNLLVGVLGNSELALGSIDEASPAREPLRNVVTAAQRASDLTTQLLAYSGHASFSVDVVDLNQVIEEIVSILSTAVSKKAKIELELTPNLAAVSVDRRQIQQVIMNLFTNASDALDGAPGVIRLTSAEVAIEPGSSAEDDPASRPTPGPYVQLTVSDTGRGMEAATLEHIFDPFFTTKGQGRGLGLAAVQGIVRSHGGFLRIASAPGEGSICSLLLPVSKDAASLPATDAREVSAPEAEPRTVLVVDDEELVRQVATKILLSQGNKVLIASDGVEGLEVFASHQAEVDAVLLDMNMPKMGGMEVFRALRRLSPGMRVLFSTGYHEQEVAELSQQSEGVGFIHKPYRVAELLEKLDALWSQSSASGQADAP